MSKMAITISGETAQELREKVRELAEGMGLRIENTKDAAPGETKPPKATAEPKTAKGKAAAANGHANGASASPFETGEPAKTAVAATAEPKMNLETAVQAAQDLLAAKGLPVVRKLLSKFGAEKVSAVKESDIPAFVKAAHPSSPDVAAAVAAVAEESARSALT